MPLDQAGGACVRQVLLGQTFQRPAFELDNEACGDHGVARILHDVTLASRRYLCEGFVLEGRLGLPVQPVAVRKRSACSRGSVRGPEGHDVVVVLVLRGALGHGAAPFPFAGAHSKGAASRGPSCDLSRKVPLPQTEQLGNEPETYAAQDSLRGHLETIWKRQVGLAQSARRCGGPWVALGDNAFQGGTGLCHRAATPDVGGGGRGANGSAWGVQRRRHRCAASSACGGTHRPEARIPA